MGTQRHQKGFSVIEVVIVLAVVVLIGGIGWLIWSRQTAAPNSTTEQSNNSETSKPSYVEVPEWGIKIKTTHANYFTYAVHNEDGLMPFSDEDEFDSSLSFKINPDLVTDYATCDSPGVTLARLKSAPSSGASAVKVGDRYYAFSGAPGICSNDADTDIKSAILNDLKNENLEAI